MKLRSFKDIRSTVLFNAHLLQENIQKDKKKYLLRKFDDSSKELNIVNTYIASFRAYLVSISKALEKTEL